MKKIFYFLQQKGFIVYFSHQSFKVTISSCYWSISTENWMLQVYSVLLSHTNLQQAHQTFTKYWKRKNRSYFNTWMPTYFKKAFDQEASEMIQLKCNKEIQRKGFLLSRGRKWTLLKHWQKVEGSYQKMANQKFTLHPLKCVGNKKRCKG